MAERGAIDSPAKLMGRNIIAVLAPKGQGGKPSGGAPKGASSASVEE